MSDHALICLCLFTSITNTAALAAIAVGLLIDLRSRRGGGRLSRLKTDEARLLYFAGHSAEEIAAAVAAAQAHSTAHRRPAEGQA